MPRCLGVIAALGLASCSFGGGFADQARFRCDTPADCPAGQACKGGFCGSDMPAADAAASDGGATTCLPADAAADGFSDASLWQEVGEPQGCSARVEGGRALISQLSDSAGCGLRSTRTFDLRGADVWIEAVETGEGAPASGFEVGGEATGWVGIYRMDDALVLLSRSEGVMELRASVPFDRENHLYWRLALRDSQHEWYTAVDGMDWTRVGTAELPQPFDPSCASVQLRTTGMQNTDVIIFDNLSQVGDS